MHKDHEQDSKWLWLAFHKAHWNWNADSSAASHHIILQLKVSESSGTTLITADTQTFAALSILLHLEIPLGNFPLLGM